MSLNQWSNQYPRHVAATQNANYFGAVLAAVSEDNDTDSNADASCPILPQPPIGKPADLEGQNAIACYERHPSAKFYVDANASKLCESYPDMIADLSTPLVYAYPGIVNPAALTLTPNPPIVTPPGQIVAYPVPVPGAPLPLAGKKVLVVGASKGIGKEVATQCVAAGAIVIGTSRHPLAYAPGSFTFPLLTLDVRKTINVQRFVAALMANQFAGGQIDVVVLCPGIHSVGQLADYSGDELSAIFDLLVSGYQRVVQAVLPFMRHSNDTRIISLGSAAGETIEGTIAAYSMCKRALQTWNDVHQSQSMVRKARGVVAAEPTFSLIEPSYVLTTIGLYEIFEPATVPPSDPNTRAERYRLAEFQNLAQPQTNTLAFCGTQIMNVIRAPQPGVRYLIDAGVPYPFPGNPTVIDFVNFAHSFSAEDAINQLTVPNLIGSDPNAARGAVLAAYI